MAGGEAGKKRARIEGTEGRAAPVSPFVATPPSQHLAKILRVRQSHGVDKGVSFARSRARAEPSEAPSSLDSERTRDSELAGPSSPASAGLRTPSAPLLARRARASVASLRVRGGVEQAETDASGYSTDAKRPDRTLVGRKTEKPRASVTKAGFANDEANARAYVPGTNMPLDGWMQRCFGCGTWTGQAVCLGAFEVFRCNECARQFRKRANELRALRARDAAAGTRDDTADAAGAASARQHQGDCHRRAASAESNELTGIASRLREFLLARCPDAGLEHSFSSA